MSQYERHKAKKALIKKNKKFKLVKRALATTFSIVIGLSSIPSIKCNIAYSQGKKDTFISTIMASEDEIEEKIAQIFIYAIRNNSNLNDEYKEKIIDSFCDYVIYPYGKYFSEETIMRMYAVAFTEDVIGVGDFLNEHGWWRGNYNPVYNYYSVYSGEESDESLFAHEQLHAIGRKNLFTVGFSGLTSGIGLNEAATAFFSDETSYIDQQNYFEIIGYIIGFDNLFRYYFNADYDGLKNELYKYLPKKEIDTLLSRIDKTVYREYYETFLMKNVEYDEERDNKYYEEYELSNSEIISSLIKLFESRYQCKISESTLGTALFYREIINNDMIDNNIKKYNHADIYLYFNDVETSKLNIHTYFGYCYQLVVENDKINSLNIDELIEQAITLSFERATDYYINRGACFGVSKGVLDKYKEWLDKYRTTISDEDYLVQINDLYNQLSTYLVSDSSKYFVFNQSTQNTL